MQKKCENCRRDFEAKASRQRFCSISCQAKTRERNITQKHGHRRPFRRTVPDSLVMKAIELAALGKSFAAIAKELKVGRMTLQKRARELGYVSGARGTRWTESQIRLPKESGQHGYIAGIIDGEGSIVRVVQGSASIQWRISVANTHKGMLKWLEQMGGSIVPRKSKLGKKPSFAWILGRQWDVLLLLETIVPFLLIKKTSALEAIEELRQVVNAMMPKSREG